MQAYWSGLQFPSLGDLLDLGIKPRSPALQVDSLLSELPGKKVINFQRCPSPLYQEGQKLVTRDDFRHPYPGDCQRTLCDRFY